MTTTAETLFDQAWRMVETGESATLAAAIRHVALVEVSDATASIDELSDEDATSARQYSRVLANAVWAVARQHGYEVGQ